MPTGAEVRLHGVEKRYGSLWALRQIEVTVTPGEWVVVTGPNGSGKTTLLRLMAGLCRPDRGQVVCRIPDAPSTRPPIGLVGHRPMLYGELTVEENLLFFARFFGWRSAAERIPRLLEEAGLLLRRRHLVKTLSRGLEQRVALVRALLPEPALLLLDEPTSHLDAAGRQWLENALLEQHRRGTTIVLATHEESLTGRATRRIGLQQGRVVTDEPIPRASWARVAP